MIITISGAACTGKTTLLESVRAKFEEECIPIAYYGEFIRMLFNDCYSHKYSDFSDLLQGDPIDIIDLHKDTARLFNSILWSSDLSGIHLFDRSPLDIGIYLYMNIANYLDDDYVFMKYREASKYIYRCNLDFMNHKPYIFYTRPFSTEVENDGFRPVSLINRRELELSLFEKEFLSLPDVQVLPSDLDERISIVSALIMHD